jgi:zinc transporter, ZIP family
VLTALLVGLAASSALVIGAVAGAFRRPPQRLIAIALAFASAFAAGAVLASLADTVMPDAYRQGGFLVAFATAASFLLTFLISQ